VKNTATARNSGLVEMRRTNFTHFPFQKRAASSARVRWVMEQLLDTGKKYQNNAFSRQCDLASRSLPILLIFHLLLLLLDFSPEPRSKLKATGRSSSLNLT